MKRWSKVISVMALAVLATMSVSIADTYVDDFEGGANASGWAYDEGTSVEAAGGNPSGWLKGDYTGGFSSPKVKTTWGAATPFHGDYVATQVTSISIDAIHIENQYGMDLGGYGMTGALYLRDNDTGMSAVAALNVAAFGNPVGSWFTVTVPIDSQAATMPANWSDPGGGLDWPTLMAGVDEVEVNWFDPFWSTIGATFVVGVDNMSINYVPSDGNGGDDPPTAEPIPTVSEWGLIITGLMLLIFVGVAIRYLR